MSKKRRKFSSGFKAKVVLEALKERQTLQDLASKYELHSSQIVNWKKEFLANASEVFEAKTSNKKGRSWHRTVVQQDRSYADAD